MVANFTSLYATGLYSQIKISSPILSGTPTPLSYVKSYTLLALIWNIKIFLKQTRLIYSNQFRCHSDKNIKKWINEPKIFSYDRSTTIREESSEFTTRYVQGAFNKFPAFFCTGILNYRRLLKIQYLIAKHRMRWPTNFYDFRFKWTATEAIGIHSTIAWLSQLVNFKNAIWT